ncbi:MAG: OmpA family protein [Deltaproteobacteria bacterium]|nr:OmpA family protein [Deltaproteobacteria bacterium]
MPTLRYHTSIVLCGLFVMIAAAGIISGCASSGEPYPMLDRAKAAYASAAANPDVKAYAPVALYDAEKALKRAEISTDLEERKHLIYLAERNVEMALVSAERKKAEKEMALLSKERDNLILESQRVEAEISAREAQAAREKALESKTEADRLKEEAEARAAKTQEAIARAAQLEKELASLKAVKTDRGMVLTLGDVLFATGKADLSPGASSTIDNLAEFLTKYPDRKVRIEGHTDSTGSAALNLDLSERRAEAVKTALLRRGISFDRIDTVGLGQSLPIASNDTASGRQQNRRVEITILEQN